MEQEKEYFKVCTKQDVDKAYIDLDSVDIIEDVKRKVVEGFDTDYYKKGQLLKICIVEINTQKIYKIDYGFITTITLNEIELLYVDENGKPHYNHITYDMIKNYNKSEEFKLYINIIK